MLKCLFKCRVCVVIALLTITICSWVTSRVVCIASVDHVISLSLLTTFIVCFLFCLFALAYSADVSRASDEEANPLMTPTDIVTVHS